MSERSRGDYGYTGSMNESDLFGEFKASPMYKAELAKLVNNEGYAPRDAAMSLLRKYYLDNPLKPSKPFAAELQKRVAQMLKLTNPEDLRRLRFYTSVGKKEVSPLDYFHGIDSWIEFTPLDEKKPIVVTIDGTLRESKDDAKADLLVKDIPDPSEDKRGFESKVEMFAKRTALLFGFEGQEKKPEMIETRVASNVVRRQRKE